MISAPETSVAPRTTPWPVASATGVGSLPGEDIHSATRLVFDELEHFPHVVELPARGPYADFAGRGIALLVDLHADIQPGGWRLVERSGADERRARQLLRDDLDVLEEVATGYAGTLKVQVPGPWSLATVIELRSLEKLLSDAGAVRDLGVSLHEGVADYLGEIRRRIPGADVVVQVDEPALPAVIEGTIPTASGFTRLAAIEQPTVIDGLRPFAQFGSAIAHCCAAEPQIEQFSAAGFRAVSLDLSLLGPGHDDAIGAAIDKGLSLFAGVVPSLDPSSERTSTALIDPILGLWSRLGFAREELSERVVVTPTCGLAGASPVWARRAIQLIRECAERLQD